MGNIVVVGIGHKMGQLTLEAMEQLKSGHKVILHTAHCGCSEWLKSQGISYEALDDLYESSEDFDRHASSAAEAVIAAAQEDDVVYGVFDVRDNSVSELLQRERNIRIIPGPPIEGALFARANGAVMLMAASEWEDAVISSSRGILIRELDSRELASEVKLKLMEAYPDDAKIYVTTEGGLACTNLYNLDRLKHYDHRTCAMVPAQKELTALESYDFDQVCAIVSRLCSPDGCPWDRIQTHESLRPYILEEAYEVIDAIQEEDTFHLCDELGDMLLQIVLHSEIARRHGEFTARDVTTAIGQKMIRRHSHIFGGDQAKDAEEVSGLWSRNKMAERGQKTYTEAMRDVTRSLPATLRAAKVLKRLDEACGCQENLGEAVFNGQEILNAFQKAEDPERDFGEMLLRLMSIARAANIDPEIALNSATDRLIDRFEQLESDSIKRGEQWDALSHEKLRQHWHLVKLSGSSERKQE